MAFWEGAKTTVNLTEATAVGLGTFIYDAVRGHSDFSQVTGPVELLAGGRCFKTWFCLSSFIHSVYFN